MFPELSLLILCCPDRTSSLLTELQKSWKSWDPVVPAGSPAEAALPPAEQHSRGSGSGIGSGGGSSADADAISSSTSMCDAYGGRLVANVAFTRELPLRAFLLVCGILRVVLHNDHDNVVTLARCGGLDAALACLRFPTTRTSALEILHEVGDGLGEGLGDGRFLLLRAGAGGWCSSSWCNRSFCSVLL